VAVVVGYVLFAGLVAVGLPRLFPWLADPETVRAAIRATGPLAPLAFLTIQALQVLVAPIPGQVLGFVAGYLFGVVLGTALSVAGATVGGYVAFVLARRYGRPVVERLVTADAIALFDGVSADHGRLVLFLFFLVPGLPDDAICFLAGVSEMDTRSFLLASVVGRTPGYFLVALAGAQVADARTTEAAALLVALAALSAFGLLGRRRLTRRFERETNRGG
jgi:uncharacterized membrane protein YdjX (TVP38/TMEM64 family)